MIEQSSLTKADSKGYMQKWSDKEVMMASEQISTRQGKEPKVGLRMRQPTLNWDTEDKYDEVKKLRLEVYNVFKSYDMSDIEKTTLIKTC